MGAAKQVFRIRATERNKRKFYQLCAAMNIEDDLLEPPTTTGGAERCGVALHLEPYEYSEMTAVANYFEIFKAGVARIAFRMGMAAIIEKMTEIYPPEPEDVPDDQEKSQHEAAEV